MTPEERGLVRLHLTKGLGRAGLIRLQRAFGSAAAALAAPPGQWQSRAGVRPAVAAAVPAADDPRLNRTLATLERLAVRLLPCWDQTRYPEALAGIHDPPALLYLRGRLPADAGLAVVGARQASAAGRRLTGELCRTLAAQGVTIVSGLARGIDAAAHRGALAAGGTTVAVLGCGVDRVYPPEHASLLEEILEGGAVVSEYPPGTLPLAGHFPGRNRIISGLSRGVLVVEAAAGSGSLITVDFALEQGREVFAVPGAVHAPTSSGVNGLLKDGAHLVTRAEDVLEVLWPGRRPGAAPRAEPGPPPGLSPAGRRVFAQLSDEPRHIDELTGKSGLTPMEVSTILLDLELQGGVRQLPGMFYVLDR